MTTLSYIYVAESQFKSVRWSWAATTKGICLIWSRGRLLPPSLPCRGQGIGKQLGTTSSRHKRSTGRNLVVHRHGTALRQSVQEVPLSAGFLFSLSLFSSHFVLNMPCERHSDYILVTGDHKKSYYATKAIWARFDLQRTRWVRYFSSRSGWLDTYNKNYKIRMAGLPFRRSIEITQNATRAPKRKPQAFESGSNEMADARLAVCVWRKIGDKCSVMRLRFAVIKHSAI